MPVTQARMRSRDDAPRLRLDEPAGEIDVVPPSWRFDLRLEEDLIEEVIRLIGYDTLAGRAAARPLRPRCASERAARPSALRHAMADLGWQETIGFSFVDERWERDFAGNANPCASLNPIVASQSVMRSSLIGSLVEVLRVNLARKAPRVRVFELGKVYLRDAGVAAGPLAGRRHCASRCGSAASPSARSRRCNGAWPSARSTSST